MFGDVKACKTGNLSFIVIVKETLLLPPVLLAVTVYVVAVPYVPGSVGVPLSVPFVVLKCSPLGRLGDMLQLVGIPSV